VKAFFRYALALFIAALIPSIMFGIFASPRPLSAMFPGVFTIASFLVFVLGAPIVYLAARFKWINIFSSMLVGFVLAFLPLAVLGVLRMRETGLVVEKGMEVGINWVMILEFIGYSSLLALFGALGGFCFWLVWYYTKLEKV